MKKLMMMITALLIGCSDRHPYPPQAVDDFVASCAKSGGTIEECRCCIDRIRVIYTYAEYQQVEQKPEQHDETLTRTCKPCSGKGR